MAENTEKKTNIDDLIADDFQIATKALEILTKSDEKAEQSKQ